MRSAESPRAAPAPSRTGCGAVEVRWLHSRPSAYPREGAILLSSRCPATLQVLPGGDSGLEDAHPPRAHPSVSRTNASESSIASKMSPEQSSNSITRASARGGGPGRSACARRESGRIEDAVRLSLREPTSAGVGRGFISGALRERRAPSRAALRAGACLPPSSDGKRLAFGAAQILYRVQRVVDRRAIL